MVGSFRRIDPRCEALFAGRATSGPFEIPPLHRTPASRKGAFQQAMKLFAVRLGKTRPNHTPDLSDDYYSHPLMVQMAALLALHHEQARTAESLTRSVVNHERRYWRSLMEGTSSSDEQGAHLMALTTLLGGVQSPREVEVIWKRAKFGTGGQLNDTFARMRYLYPERAGIQGLKPDLLGESLVTQVLLSDNGLLVLETLFDRVDSQHRHDAWTVLARILRHRADVMPLIQAYLSKHFLKKAPSRRSMYAGKWQALFLLSSSARSRICLKVLNCKLRNRHSRCLWRTHCL